MGNPANTDTDAETDAAPHPLEIGERRIKAVFYGAHVVLLVSSAGAGFLAGGLLGLLIGVGLFGLLAFMEWSMLHSP
ncbi:MAG: hypothetical protein N2C14_11015 [Planctomycetales bacterium]